MKISIASLASVALVLATSASAGKPNKYVTSEKLQKAIKIDKLLKGAQKLQNLADAHGGNRAFGSGGHNATVDWLYKTLRKLDYYNVVKQPFTELYSEGESTLLVDGESVASSIMTYTPAGTSTGPLFAIPGLGCTAEDFPPEAAGQIVLLSRGECTFGQKSINAKTAGAAAIVIYNNVPGPLSGTLGAAFAKYAPVVGISQEDGQAILEKLQAGEVVANLEIDAVTENRVNYNVIAETKRGDHNNVLVLGGHSDSVAAGPGIK